MINVISSTTSYAYLSCFIYMFMGPSLILLNKHILNTLNFPFPYFLSSLGVLVSAIFSHTCVHLNLVNIKHRDHIQGYLWYQRVLPIGLAYAITLGLGNLVYLYLNVGFIQMLKSFTPVILLFTGYIFQVETPTSSTVASIFIISVGTAASCTYTLNANVSGIVIMFSAELAESIRLVLTQYLLQNLKFSVIEGQYVLAPPSAFWLLLASVYFEFPKIMETRAYLIIYNNPLTFLLASLMGLGINFLSYFVIQVTSSLTMKILGTLRNILTLLLGVLIYHEIVTTNEMIGYFIALIGFMGYNLSKMGYFASKISKNEDLRQRV